MQSLDACQCTACWECDIDSDYLKLRMHVVVASTTSGFSWKRIFHWNNADKTASVSQQKSKSGLELKIISLDAVSLTFNALAQLFDACAAWYEYDINIDVSSSNVSTRPQFFLLSLSPSPSSLSFLSLLILPFFLLLPFSPVSPTCHIS